MDPWNHHQIITNKMANSGDHLPAAVFITLYALSNLILTTSYAR